ncbi:zinc transporter ZupT [Garciella nitratireducens]|uniref:zinc transporter ZupT n=1 Tax=Garciella nitratireducens TaxID=218205 RepID=UPI000DE8F737|nr:zinc transporter ZupT [Garciella nitratireducens]RBP40636.1 ZIP family zinc transporter [Garciella nitratireducens]
MEKTTLLSAFGITLIAGLSTGLGGALAFHSKTSNKKFLSITLGFSAGVMIYVSMIEIFAQAKTTLQHIYGLKLGYWYTTIAFFGGIIVMALIDKLVPEKENPHEFRDVKEIYEEPTSEDLKRMGLFSALAITIHNFPEGLATFISTLQDPSLGISIGIAIAIHNIPEGIAVAVPIYFSTGNKKQAFKYSFLSGLSEPLGALIGFTLLRPFINNTLLGMVFSFVAGIMVYISLDELLPTAEKYGYHHHAIYGLIGGMAIMALSLLLTS